MNLASRLGMGLRGAVSARHVWAVVAAAFLSAVPSFAQS